MDLFQPEFSLQLAEAVRCSVGKPLSHLKLQKLVFYSYGALTAHVSSTPEVLFEAWKHGPVCRSVYREFRDYGSEPIPVPSAPTEVEHQDFVDATCRVYGLLSAWQLRNESHLEAPWIDAYNEASTALLNDAALRAHFRAKFCNGSVEAPKHLPGAWSAGLDGIPSVSAPTLKELSTLLE